MSKMMEDILSDFGPEESEDNRVGPGHGQAVTIWLPASAKARYDRLQQMSGRKLSKKAREVLLALIDAAEAKAS